MDAYLNDITINLIVDNSLIATEHFDMTYLTINALNISVLHDIINSDYERLKNNLFYCITELQFPSYCENGSISNILFNKKIWMVIEAAKTSQCLEARETIDNWFKKGYRKVYKKVKISNRISFNRLDWIDHERELIGQLVAGLYFSQCSNKFDNTIINPSLHTLEIYRKLVDQAHKITTSNIFENEFFLDMYEDKGLPYN